jgi:branched-chain amino acid transport system permease protein
VSQAIIDGILTGGLYAAFGIGLSLIYGVTRVISAVHGALIVLGAYLVFTWWSAWGIDPFLAIPALIVVGFALGYAIQRIFINRVVRRNIVMTITLTLGLDLMVITAVMLIWGAELKSITVPYASHGFDAFGVRVPWLKLGIFAAAVALALGLDYVLRRTEAGRRIRAVSQDRTAAELIGLDPGHYYGLAHGFAAAVAVPAGAFVALIQPLQPFMGLPLLLIAFAVVVLAGFGSVAPVLVAGLVLGISGSVAGYLIGPEYQRLSLFVMYLAVATLRPAGLFGQRYYAH